MGAAWLQPRALSPLLGLLLPSCFSPEATALPDLAGLGTILFAFVDGEQIEVEVSAPPPDRRVWTLHPADTTYLLGFASPYDETELSGGPELPVPDQPSRLLPTPRRQWIRGDGQFLPLDGPLPIALEQLRIRTIEPADCLARGGCYLGDEERFCRPCPSRPLPEAPSLPAAPALSSSCAQLDGTEALACALDPNLYAAVGCDFSTPESGCLDLDEDCQWPSDPGAVYVRGPTDPEAPLGATTVATLVEALAVGAPIWLGAGVFEAPGLPSGVEIGGRCPLQTTLDLAGFRGSGRFSRISLSDWPGPEVDQTVSLARVRLVGPTTVAIEGQLLGEQVQSLVELRLHATGGLQLLQSQLEATTVLVGTATITDARFTQGLRLEGPGQAELRALRLEDPGAERLALEVRGGVEVHAQQWVSRGPIGIFDWTAKTRVTLSDFLIATDRGHALSADASGVPWDPTEVPLTCPNGLLGTLILNRGIIQVPSDEPTRAMQVNCVQFDADDLWFVGGDDASTVRIGWVKASLARWLVSERGTFGPPEPQADPGAGGRGIFIDVDTRLPGPKDSDVDAYDVTVVGRDKGIRIRGPIPTHFDRVLVEGPQEGALDLSASTSTELSHVSLVGPSTAAGVGTRSTGVGLLLTDDNAIVRGITTIDHFLIRDFPVACLSIANAEIQVNLLDGTCLDNGSDLRLLDPAIDLRDHLTRVGSSGSRSE